MRKFCPSDLEKVKPCLASSDFTADGSDNLYVSCKTISSERPYKGKYSMPSGTLRKGRATTSIALPFHRQIPNGLRFHLFQGIRLPSEAHKRIPVSDIIA